jgi:SAM-dependent methyltransferase/tetratricopeptide (TPR) repeat protein
MARKSKREPRRIGPAAAQAAPQGVLYAMQAAVAEHRRGRLEAAIAGYRRVLRLRSGFPEAHNNLAVALKAAGRLEEAAASYRRALALRPDYPVAHANLATALAVLGRRQDGLKHALEAVRLEPGNGAHRRVLVDALRSMRFGAASAQVVQAVATCFQADDVEHQLLTPAALSLLRLNPAAGTALALAAAGDDAGLAAALGDGRLDPLVEDRLFRMVMTRTLVADPAFERLLTGLRRLCLHALTAKAQSRSGLLHDDPGFVTALARQCFITNYAYAESAEESARVARLAKQAAGGEPSVTRLAVLAMYRPLHELPAGRALAEQAEDLPTALAGLIRQQLHEPLAEQEIAGTLPCLTPVEAGVSEAVRGQYEMNPYPRWLSTTGKAPRSFAEHLRTLFPHLSPLREPAGAPHILVAGCGTGKHAIDVAARHPDAAVLAIDLSRNSLAYARRKAHEAGLERIRFAQADILALGGLEERFDLIEAVGVLHHLADPLAGWRQLAGLLKPGGFMKIGLYSTRARSTIAEARGFVRQAGFAADAAGIRAARQAILALDPGVPAHKVTGELDFYSLSGCRDLLFNVQERSYDLAEIAAALDSLGLGFIGFEFADPEAPQAYARRFPEDPEMTDLGRWDAFETKAPETFHNMYQFWCRKA